ncbi:MAG: efflux transporter outer membrane subunit [Verrucomicrobia bacterium]|nr:efflux transporter outer membrane subunit [Verrucomicrobiota bacterium]
MKPIPLILIALLALAVTGCVVGPNYHRPALSSPAHWSEPLAGGESNAPADLDAWWKSFHDPELDSLIARATASNLDLRSARARVLEARARYGIASAALWPSADVSGSYARAGTSHHQPVLGSLPVPPEVPFENDVYQVGFDASWELDVFGGQRRAREAARAEVGAAEYGRRDTLLTLLGDVARNYLEVRADQRRLAIARENLRAQAEALAIAQDRFTNGVATDLDVQQAATLLATTEAEVPALKTARQAGIHRLGVLLGLPPGALLAELSEDAPIPAAPPEVPVGLPSDLLLRRPDVQKAERQLAAATANIGVAMADLFPKISLTGIGGFESISSGDWFTAGSRFWSLGPTVQWKIFEAGRIRANIRVQTARQEQALAAYERTALSAFQDVEDGLEAYANEQVRRRSLRTAVASSRESLDLARRLYTQGLTAFVNVLEAERSLYQAEDALVQSDRAVATDVVALYKALGGGWQTAESRVTLAHTVTP